MGRGLRSSPGTGKKDCILLDFQRQHRPHGRRLQRHFLQRPGRARRRREARQDDLSRQRREAGRKACPVADTSRWASAAFPVGTRLSSHLSSSTSTARCRKSGSARRNMPTTSAICGSRHARMHAGIRRLISSKGRAKHIFRDITGEWPDSSWNIATTPSVQITRAVLNKIKSRNIAYAKSIWARAA